MALGGEAQPDRQVSHGHPDTGAPDPDLPGTPNGKVLVSEVRSRRFPLVGWRRQDYVAFQSKGGSVVSCHTC